MPSAAAFDALFRRVDVGDLTALSASEQRKVVGQLAQLLPPGDAHRARLLDTQRCGLDFANDNQKGYEFADSRLAEALAAHDDSAAIRFYYCRGGYLESLKTPRDALADFERGIDLARAAGKDAMLASGLQARGGMYSLLGIYGKALADLLEARRLFTEQELDEAASQILQDIGITYRRLGYPDKAREYLNQAVAHEKQVGDTESLYISTLQLGYADQETGQYESALATQRRALELATTTGDRASIASVNLAIASVLTDLHRYAEAQSALREFTLSLDVPHVHRSEQPFVRMRDAAIALAASMEGLICDDKGQVIRAEALDLIGSHLEKLYDVLEARDLAAGSPQARRLFS